MPRNKRRVILLLSLALLAASGFAGAEESIMKETNYVPFTSEFYNPILSDANDPWVTFHDGFYYYCRSWNSGVEIAKSPTLTGIEAYQAHAGSIKNVRVASGQTEIWAPELHFYQNHWYIFYAADYNTDNRLHRMYAIRSETDDALGEWGEPVKLDLPEDQWAIDGTFFENADGRIFHIWSGWKNEAQGTSLWKQYLYIAELEKDNPTKVISTERVMIAKPEYYWEMSVLPQNEGPSVLVSPSGTVYCMYAGNYSGSNEYVEAAVRLNGDDPMDARAWEKLPEPMLSSNPEVPIYAPGHASFIKSPDGSEDWMVIHTAKASESGWDRNARALKIKWVNDEPTTTDFVSSDVLQTLPSGETVDRILIQVEDGVLTDNVTMEEGLTTSPAVRFANNRDSHSTITVSVEKDGLYPVYVRHNNPSSDQSAFWLRVNGGERRFQVPASRTGGETQFVVTCQLVPLDVGMNTLELSAGPGLAFDLIILDRTPVE